MVSTAPRLVGAVEGGHPHVTRVLVTGAGGQLGRDLVSALLIGGHEPIGVTRAGLDITDADDVGRAIGDTKPDVVVNCAAWTAVDACEAEPERAMAVNGHAVGTLAGACRGSGARLVQISTDYVFDGELQRPYVEDDATHPLSAYGRSKLVGEHAAQSLGDLGLVVRTSWVFSGHGGNMYATVRRLLDAGTPLRFVDDQRGCPTYTVDLATTLVRLIDIGARGIFHVTNQGATTWHGFVRAVVEACGGNPDIVEPIATADLNPPRPAPRPANSVLANRALQRAGLPAMRDFRDALAELTASGSAAGRPTPT